MILSPCFRGTVRYRSTVCDDESFSFPKECFQPREAEGAIILRFENKELYYNLEGVLNEITDFLKECRGDNKPNPSGLRAPPLKQWRNRK